MTTVAGIVAAFCAWALLTFVIREFWLSAREMRECRKLLSEMRDEERARRG